MKTYPIIGNCNYESSASPKAEIILAATGAVEGSLTNNSDLVAALDALEETLAEDSESDNVLAINRCRAAESDVVSAYNAIIDEIISARARREANHQD